MNVFLFKYSWVYRIYIVAIHFFAMCCILTTFPYCGRLIGLLLLMGCCVFYALRTEEIVMLKWMCKKEWIVHTAMGEMVCAEILPSSVMMPWFLILHFEGMENKRNMRCVIFYDSLRREDFYHLRRCVRCAFL